MLRFFLFCSLFIANQAEAFYTELGFNYSYKKTVVDSLNNIEQQGITGSVSLYFWDQVATEFSYTNSLYVKRERADSIQQGSNTQRVTTQVADIYGLDLIYVFTHKKATFQPYVKGGVAYIKKSQSTFQENLQLSDPVEVSGWGPSYGLGFKFFVTEAVAFRVGWDVVRTPIGDSQYVDDQSGRVGISWMF